MLEYFQKHSSDNANIGYFYFRDKCSVRKKEILMTAGNPSILKKLPDSLLNEICRRSTGPKMVRLDELSDEILLVHLTLGYIAHELLPPSYYRLQFLSDIDLNAKQPHRAFEVNTNLWHAPVQGMYTEAPKTRILPHFQGVFPCRLHQLR